MDYDEYILPIKKWWWLIVTAVLVAGLTSYVIVRRQPPIYQTHTTLMVGQTIANPNPNSGDFYLEQSLVGVYIDMASREPVRTATMNALGLTFLPDYVVQPVPNSQLLEIQVTDSDQKRAMLVAAELAHQLVLRSPEGATSSNQDRQSFLDDQLNSLQNQITATEAEIAKLQKQLGDINSAKQIADAQVQINALQTKLSTLQSNYAGLLSNTQKGAVNSLTVIEPAELPVTPVNPNKTNTVLLAMAIGLFISTSGAYGIEFFDRTVKTTTDVHRLMDLPVIGYIAEMRDKGKEWMYYKKHPQTPITEAFRALRSRIEFSNAEAPLKTIYVSSITASAGKTTVAMNLALAFIGMKKRVLIIDADLHRPKIHEILGESKTPGLNDVLNGHMSIYSVIRSVSSIPELKVIVAGTISPVSEENNFTSINPIFSVLDNMFDIIIIDGPPYFVTDGSILASQVDGMLLIIRPGQIRPDVARAVKDQLIKSNARVIGTVFNRITRSDVSTYQGFYYYSPYNANPEYLQSEHQSVNLEQDAEPALPKKKKWWQLG